MRNTVYMSLLLAVMIGMLSFQANAQQMTQTIRGSVVDHDSKEPLIGCYIKLEDAHVELGALTDEDGLFRLENVPVGRVNLKVSYIGYEDKNMPNILVGSGKEVVLNIELVESVNSLRSTVISARRKKSKVINDMAVVSARSFSVEQTKRYAGAIDDPARMVSAFAGVNGNAEGNNDIVVRGNSPRGVLWRLEGIEIPNPNHFAAEGGTGGPINALNSAMLGNSDFFTGAFSPEYGNALSGVFDMKLRNGNNEKREYAASLSILGTDLTVEGPFNSKYGGSYLANYRYSTLSILDETGLVNFGGVPKYQDACFKLRLPAGDKHTFSVFGLGGINSISQENTNEDETKVLASGEFGGKLGVLGASHTYRINKKAYLKTTLSSYATEMNSFYDIPDENDNMYTVASSKFVKSTLSGTSVLNYKFNARSKVKAGLIWSRLGYDMDDKYWSFDTDQLESRLKRDGNASTLQAYLSWKYRITNDISVVNGLHYINFRLNNNQALEPRFALKWQQTPKRAYSVGFGLHSKTESIATYLGQQQQTDGSFIQPNVNLDLSKAAHFVAGYNYQVSNTTYIKAEAYYQHLYNVPVEDVTNSTYSLINASDWFTTRSLTNQGKGRNYGVELTLERSFSKNFYYMSTVSIYRSLYTAMDGQERKSAYDGNYVVNFLGGKEFNVGKAEKKRVLFINAKAAFIGGSRYTPIDLEKSIQLGDAVRDEANPYSAMGDDVLKIDLAIGLRRNRAKTTTELKLDIQNVTNNAAVVNQYYEHATQSIVISNQLPLLPVLSYKVNF